MNKKDLSSRVVVVLNPTAGNRRGLKQVLAFKDDNSVINNFADEHNYGVPSAWPLLLTTPNQEWFSELQDYVRLGLVDTVVVVGGDGTLMEVAWAIETLQATRDRPVAIFSVPGGRGNDFFRGIYSKAGEPLSLDFDKFWKWAEIGRWERKPLDLVQTTDGRLFMNMASIGYGGRVVAKIQNSQSFWSKRSSVYQVQGALTFLQEKEVACSLYVDSKNVYSGPFFGAFVGNGKANAAGLLWLPSADVSDGKIDCIIFAKPALHSMMLAMGSLKKAEDPTFSHLRFRGKHFEFKFEDNVPVEVDGTFIGEAQSHGFKCLPSRLNLWVLKK